ncbi:MAG: HEAT repeat domain-containing protein [Anaerolineae bacterium]
MSAIPELDDLLYKLIAENYDERYKAKHDIIKYGTAAVEPLIQFLGKREAIGSGLLIVDALGVIGDKRAVEPLKAVLSDPANFDDSLLRKYTAWALGKLKDARATDELINVLHDRIHEEDDDGYITDEPDRETIAAAVWALAEIGDPRAVKPVLERIFEGDFWAEGSVLTSWGNDALKLLLTALDNDNENIRDTACALLGEFGDVSAVEQLIHRLKTDASDRVRGSAAYALSEIADPRAYDILLTALNDRYEHVRAKAATGLGRLKDNRALYALRQATHDESPQVRNSANWAIDWLNQA